MFRNTLTWAVIMTLLVGCETPPKATSQPKTAVPAKRTQRANIPATAGPVAYINGQTITHADLRGRLVEAAGGQILSELVLDKMIRDRLVQQGLELGPELIDQEKAHMLSTLSADPNEAVRLLNKMRSDRGLGELRFKSMLYRNAGLRLLVHDDVAVPQNLVRQAYDLSFGERYRVRIIVADTLQKASALRTQATAGEPFADLASLHSTDASAAQGGLLSPISLADNTYPKALRQALASMQVGDISDLIATDDHFIIMKYEEAVPAESTTYEQARADLERTVRLELEGQQMQQAARSMLVAAKVVILEPVLNKSWLTQKAKTGGN
jgi:parvulin-like peptidyl-prolyl isomerase